MIKAPELERKIRRYYHYAYYLASLCFVLANLAMTPSLHSSFSLAAYTYCLRGFALLSMLTHILEYLLGEQYVPWREGIGGCSMLGNFLFLVASNNQRPYNEGIIYLVAAFFLSLGQEIRLTFFIFSKYDALSNAVQEERYRLYQEIALCIGIIMFLFSSVTREAGLEAELEGWSAAALATAAACCTTFSAYMLYKKSKYRGKVLTRQTTSSFRTTIGWKWPAPPSDVQ